MYVFTCSPDRKSTLLVPLFSVFTSQNTDSGRNFSSMEAAVGMRVRVHRRLEKRVRGFVGGWGVGWGGTEVRGCGVGLVAGRQDRGAGSDEVSREG